MNTAGNEAPTLSVSIVVYNSSLELLQRTLHSLQAAADAGGAAAPRVAVTVVDNASAETYRRELEQLLAAVPSRSGFSLTLLQAAENLGYGAGHNRALARARGEFHLILNPDVEVGPDALYLGVGYLQAHPRAALLSPLAHGSAGEREFLCKRYPSVLVLALRAFAPVWGRRLFPRRMAAYEMSDLEEGREVREVPLASGCFMLVRGEPLSAVGGFDEGYFLYFEDFDLSLRIARCGQVLFHPGLHIVHHGGYAARKGWRHLSWFASSGLRFFRQHGWRWI